MSCRSLAIASLCLAALGAPVLRAQAPTPLDAMVVTRGQVVVARNTLHYTVQTGQIPIYDNDTGDLMARMFIMAYVADRVPGQAVRPLTFIWNGGPGSSSCELHLVGFGPKAFKTPATYPEWTMSPLTDIVDNPATWLTAGDLVFVDPIGTGYSRATSEKGRDILYTSHGDAEAVAEMIRVYRTRYNAFDAPLFIAGESYGTTRAALVAEALERRRTHLSGVILISGELRVGQSVPSPLNSALQVSLYTVTGHFHKRLAADLQAMPRDEAAEKAVEWARKEYAPALEGLERLTPAERTGVLNGLKRYTGIDPQFIDGKTLTIGKDVFVDRLLDDSDQELGRYDSRMSSKRRPMVANNWTPTEDPSIKPLLDLMQGTSAPAIRYIRETLQYRSDLLYRGPFGEAFHPLPLKELRHGIYDDWMSVMWNRAAEAGGQAPPTHQQPTGTPASEPPLLRAMELNPKLMVFNIQGMYDESCAAGDEAISRARADIKVRIRNGCYAAGHTVYTDVATRQELRRDYAKFVDDALRAGH